MPRTEIPAHQIKDEVIKNVDIAQDADIALSKIAKPSSLTEKSSLADNDMVTIGDSADSNSWKKVLWSTIKNLFLSKTNTTEYTPSADYHPATKKYVDDNAGGTLPSFVAGENLTKGDVVQSYLDGSTQKVKKFIENSTYGFDILSDKYNLNGVSSDLGKTRYFKLDTNKFLYLYYTTPETKTFCGIANVSGTTITYGEQYEVGVGGSAGVYYFDLCVIDTNKIIVCYVNSGNLYCKVGTISNDVITFGTEQTIQSGNIGGWVGVCEIDTDKFVVTYKGASNYLYARVCTVATTTVTVGDASTVNNTAFTSAYVCKLTTDKFLCSYTNASNTSLARAGSVSTRTITLGSALTVESASCLFSYCCYMDTDKAIVVYKGNDTYGKAVVITASDTTLSKGTIATFSGTNVVSYTRVSKIATDKFAVGYGQGNNTVRCIVATISGTDITFGSDSTIVSSNPSEVNIIQLDTDKFLVNYYISPNINYLVAGTVSTTTITLGTIQVLISKYAYTIVSGIKAIEISENRLLIAYSDQSKILRFALLNVSSSGFSNIVYYESNISLYNTASYKLIDLCKIDNNKFVVGYLNASARSSVVAGSVSGDTITLGSSVELKASVGYVIKVASIDTNKFVAFYEYLSTYYRTCFRVGTVSDNTITLGTELADTEYSDTASLSNGYPCLIKLETDKFALGITVYKDASTNLAPLVIIGTVSSTTITATSNSIDTPSSTILPYISIVYNNPKLLIFYNTKALKSGTISVRTYTNEITSEIDNFGSYLRIPILLKRNHFGVLTTSSLSENKIVTDSCTSICHSALTSSFGAFDVSLLLLSNNFFAVVTPSSSYGNVISVKKCFTTSSILGLANSTVISGNNVGVVTDKKIISGLSSLTKNEDYYVNGSSQLDLATNAINGLLDDIKVGFSLSDTELLVDLD